MPVILQLELNVAMAPLDMVCLSLSFSVRLYPDTATLAPSLSYNEHLKRKLAGSINIALLAKRLYKKKSKRKLVVASVGDAVEQFRFVLLGSRVSIFSFL